MLIDKTQPNELQLQSANFRYNFSEVVHSGLQCNLKVFNYFTRTLTFDVSILAP